jgi:hypothetical protein
VACLAAVAYSAVLLAGSLAEVFGLLFGYGLFGGMAGFAPIHVRSPADLRLVAAARQQSMCERKSSLESANYIFCFDLMRKREPLGLPFSWFAVTRDTDAPKEVPYPPIEKKL